MRIHFPKQALLLFHFRFELQRFLLPRGLLSVLSNLRYVGKIETLQSLDLRALADPPPAYRLHCRFKPQLSISAKHPRKSAHDFTFRRTFAPRHIRQPNEHRQTSFCIHERTIPDEQAKRRTSRRAQVRFTLRKREPFVQPR